MKLDTVKSDTGKPLTSSTNPAPAVSDPPVGVSEREQGSTYEGSSAPRRAKTPSAPAHAAGLVAPTSPARGVTSAASSTPALPTSQLPAASLAALSPPSSPEQHDENFLASNHASLIAKINGSLAAHIVREPKYSYDAFYKRHRIDLSVRVKASYSERVYSMYYSSTSIGSRQAFQDNFNADNAFLHLAQECPEFRLDGIHGTDNVRSGEKRHVTINGTTFAGDDYDKVFDRRTGTIDVSLLRDRCGTAKGSGLRSAVVGDRSLQRLDPPFYLDLSV